MESRKKYWSVMKSPLDLKSLKTYSGGVNYDPVVLLLFSKAIGAGGEYCRLVSNFQLKNWWRA